jgi:hypothetical protein
MRFRTSFFLAVPLAAAILGLGCQTPPKPPVPRPVAAVQGIRVLLVQPAATRVTAVGCPEAIIDTLPVRLTGAAQTALSAAGFAVVGDPTQEHQLEVRLDSEVVYCNGEVGIANGNAGLALAKGGAVIHRTDGQGELSSQTSATSLFGDLVNTLIHDAAVIRAVDEVRAGR